MPMFTASAPVARRSRRRALAACGALLAVGVAPTALAALKVGARAPDFALQAARGGKPFTFRLAEALQRGPVVVYFYPKAFTQGCTIEAHAFAEATPKFEAAGATVVGVSSDDLDTLKRFSVEACRDRFAVAADPKAQTIAAYDAKLALIPDTADRISYVVDRDGRIVHVWSSVNPLGHVETTLKAVQELARKPVAAH